MLLGNIYNRQPLNKVAYLLSTKAIIIRYRIFPRFMYKANYNRTKLAQPVYLHVDAYLPRQQFLYLAQSYAPVTSATHHVVCLLVFALSRRRVSHGRSSFMQIKLYNFSLLAGWMKNYEMCLLFTIKDVVNTNTIIQNNKDLKTERT